MSDVTPIRDPLNDPLLTPQNAVLAMIDYQPEQYAGVRSVGRMVIGTSHAADVIFRSSIPDIYAASARDLVGFAYSL